MKDPIVVRINKFLTRDDFRKEAEKFKRDNPDIIVLPAEYELLYPDVIPVTRCRDCTKYKQGMTVTEWYFCSRTGALVDGQDFCSWAERKDDGTV